MPSLAAPVRHGSTAQIISNHGEGPRNGTLGAFVRAMRTKGAATQMGSGSDYLFDRGGFFSAHSSLAALAKKELFPPVWLQHLDGNLTRGRGQGTGQGSRIADGSARAQKCTGGW